MERRLSSGQGEQRRLVLAYEADVTQVDWTWAKDADTDRRRYRFATVTTKRERLLFAFAYPTEDGYRLRVSDASLNRLYTKDYNGGRETALHAINKHLRRAR